MSNFLNAVSLAIGLMGSEHPMGSGPSDWHDYVWKTEQLRVCNWSSPACPPMRQRWDWKRDQWVEFSYLPNTSKGSISLRLRLINNDPSDDDDVCVTALFLDKKGNDVAVFHQNRHSYPRTDKLADSTISVSAIQLKKIARVVVGSKQCRLGPHQDDAIYSAAKARLKQK